MQEADGWVCTCARDPPGQLLKLGGGCGFVLIWHVAGPALTAFISVRGAVPLLCFVFCPPCRCACAPPARPPARRRRRAQASRWKIKKQANEAGKYAQPSAVSLDISQPSGRQ